MSRGVRAIVLSLLLTAVGAVPAWAACTITVTAVNFGDYDVFSVTPEDASGTIGVTCAPRENIQVTLSTGSAPTFSPRTLRNGSNVLNFNLYRNAARTQIWGDGSSGTFVFSANNVLTRTVTIFGRVPAAQDASIGAYSDNIVATVIF